jgi:hypothetical protein
MMDQRETAGGRAPLWIRCTAVVDTTPIHMNMAFAATIVARGSGARIFISEKKRAIDVIETPAEIAAAMKVAEGKPAPREAIEPGAFVFPIARPGRRSH